MSTRSPSHSRWLHNAPVDLLIGCGAWTLPLFILTYLIGSGELQVLMLVFYYLAWFVNNPHYMATWVRAFSSREDFLAHRTVIVGATVLAAGALVAGHFSWTFFLVLWTVYLTWSPWHYSSQNFGLALLFLKHRGLKVEAREKKCLSLSFIFSCAAWFFAVHVQGNLDPYVITLGIPVFWSQVAVWVCLTLFAGFGIFAWMILLRRGSLSDLFPSLVLWLTQTLWFAAPVAYQSLQVHQFSTASYSGGVLAFMHCAQYLWFTTYFSRRQQGEKAWGFDRYYLLLIVGGLALFVPGPWLASRLFGFDLAQSALVFIAVVNIHHFIIDGVVWKLREKRVSRILEGEETSLQPSSWERLWGSLSGRTLLAGVIAVVLMIGMVDLFQYFILWGKPTEDRLEIARKINPQDTRVYLKWAQLLDGKSDTRGALEQARKARGINPNNSSAQNAYGLYLLKAGFSDDAYEYYRSLYSDTWNYPGPAFVYGRLSAERGQFLEAAQALSFVYEMDPYNDEALMMAADSYLHAGKPDLARQLMNRFRLLKTNPEFEFQWTEKLSDSYAATGNPREAAALWAALRGRLMREDQLQRSLVALGKLTEFTGLTDAKEADRMAVEGVERSRMILNPELEGLFWYQMAFRASTEKKQAPIRAALYFKACSLLKPLANPMGAKASEELAVAEKNIPSRDLPNLRKHYDSMAEEYLKGR
ncbi:MAG: tetratricopeptide repeat protein [Verrucomicrobiae bacterium]|nr:tetratricopeptide repeat protein [Verrucomicrobiae bacterium]